MPTFKFTTTTKHTAASESKRRAKFIHHQAGWKGRKIRTHTFPSVLKAWWKSTPNPPCNVARHVQESRSKQHGCFVTAPTVREERRRARAFVGVRDLQERGFFRRWEKMRDCERKMVGGREKSMNGFCSALLSRYFLFILVHLVYLRVAKRLCAVEGKAFS